MDRWIKWVVALVAAVFLALAASGLVLRSLVSGSAKDKLVASLSQKTGVPVSVASVEFDLAKWFLLRPAVSLTDVSAGNPPGFSSKNLFQAKQISAQVSLGALLGGTIDVHSLRIVEPQIAIEKNAQGLSNAGAMLQSMSSAPGATTSGSAGSGNKASASRLAIDDFSVTSGSVTLPGSQSPSIQALDLHLSNLSAGSACKLEVSAKLFGGSTSRLMVDAQAGPFTSGSLPLDGKVSVTIALSEIPEAIRHAEFGRLLDAPGSSAKADLESTVRGDLYGTLAGPAKLVLTDVHMGRDAKDILPLSGETSANLTASSLMAGPQFDLKIPGSQLKLGKGAWNANAEIESRDGKVSGTMGGSIHNVEISQLLEAFTTANGKMNGVVAIPSFSVQFAGKNADEIRGSLKGSAKLAVTHGQIASMNFLATIEHAIGQTSAATPGAKGITAFDSLTADVKIGQLKMAVSNLSLDGPSLKADGSGVIGFDHSLHFDLTTHISGSVAHVVNTATLHPLSDTADLPVTVTGTVESPQVRPSVKKIASGAVKGIIDSFLKKK